MFRLLRFFQGAVTLSEYESMAQDRLERAHQFMDAALANRSSGGGTW